MDRLLRSDTPPGGKCDVKTLATEAGVTRAALYATYLPLKEEFERRRDQIREAGVIVDPREAQIDRLKALVDQLKQRLADQEQHIAGLTAFRIQAVSRLAAQHEEIPRLRSASATGDAAGAEASNVRTLSTTCAKNRHG